MTIKVEVVKSILFRHLLHFNTSGKPVTTVTPFEDALSGNSVAGTSARDIYKAVCRHDIVGNGGDDIAWPANWLKMNCDTLAPVLAAPKPQGASQ